jgi:hypothetical protein
MEPDVIHQHWSSTLDDLAKETGLERWRIEEAFGYGGCALLAIEIAEHRGLPISVVGTAEIYSHAFCVVGPGYGLDIWGVRSFQEILAMWIDDDPEYVIRSVTFDELKALGGSHLSADFINLPSRLAQDGCLAGAVLDDFTISEFNCGACGDFAAVMHDITGWPMRAELDSSGDVEHVWVVDPDGRAIDINGHHSGSRAITPYSNAKSGRIVDIAREDASSDNRYGQENRLWARALIDRYPDRFGLPEPNPSPSPLSF